ncbi:putative peptidoglycan biosynthesis protein MurJ [Marinobacterium sp. xm-a-121]|nr:MULTISPECIES: murein biosynthesis integral membrane protein MurJ [unclassified Marinobacterium]NRP37660.1 putative peptidoglycan biosynthesis protein MurJ [Marinobacterium sp. xm-a-121]NRP52922.1 putative peptidoglycan biosynthesis protein MurJ [Marinobacterium sp. xm-v-242]NRP77503.1 putative peptidoglycan biosynthesis protein MurJ [Marinobacterium sp. xm-m-383]NRQ00620.1 putative peptidoglycan biosynthesis protein MurJ [Marinobacterium sp. xm-v-233]
MSQKATSGGGLLRSSAVVGIMTMISRVLGLIRDVVVAGYFGASGASDAFFVAFKIPNFLRRLFAEGAFAQAFVPVLSEYRSQRDLKAVQFLVNRTAGSLGSVLLLVTLVGSLGSPLLAMLFAPGFYMSGSESFGLAADMLRITFPYLMLISLTAFCGAILNSYERFAVPAFTPVLLNLCLIGSAVYLSPMFDPPIMALAWGVLMAGTVQLLFQLPFLARLRLLPVPQAGWKDEGVRRILKLMLPALFGVSVAQINLLLDTVLASFLQTGSVSWLYYSDRLAELPLGVFGIAIATVILPSLSRKHAEKSGEEFAKMLDWAVRMVLLIGIPSAVALILLAEPLLTTLFHYGEMTDRDVSMAAMSLRAYGLGLLAFMLIKVLAPGYFSRQDTKTPVKIAVKAMVANMVFNLILIFPLAHAGLALATALSAFMNAGWLLHGLIKQGVFKWQTGWLRWSMQLLFANALMAVVILLFAPVASDWLSAGLWQRVEWMFLLVAGAVLVYCASLILSGVRIRHLRG